MRLRSLERFIKLFLPRILTEPIRRRRRAGNDRRYDNIPDRPEVPLALPTGQAVVCRGFSA